MPSIPVSISTTEEKLEKIDNFLIKNKRYTDRSSLYNAAIDFYLSHLETRYMSDFIYYVGLPLIAFIGSIGITLFLKDLFFYIVTGIIGIYLIILCYLFIYKYRRK